MTQAIEKKPRRTKEEILVLVDKAEKLISNGTPKTKAAESVGLAYQVLTKHLGEGVKAINTGDKVNLAYQRLVDAITEKVKRDLWNKLG